MSEQQQLTLAERKETAAQLSEEFVKTIRKGEAQEIAHRPAELSLFGIEQHIIDLVAFRQDAVERLAELKQLPGDDAAEEILEVQAEIDAANVELANLAGAEVQKVDNCAALLRMCDVMEAHCKDQRDRLNAKAKRWRAIKESVEGVVMEALELAHRTAFDSQTNRLRIQRNGQPRVEILNPQAVQSRFVNVVVQFTVETWNKIRTALPDLKPEQYQEKERTFASSLISAGLKKAAKETDAAQQILKGEQLQEALLVIEREKPRGAELRYGKHLRVE